MPFDGFDIDAARARLADLEPADPARVRDDLGFFARPRMSGTEQAAVVEWELRDRFETLGYQVQALPFSFSAWPGRFGLSVAGGVLCTTALLATGLLRSGRPVGALVTLVIALLLALTPWLSLGRALRDLPWGRIESANLLFRRPGTTPSWILMAHRDSKSQLVPTLVRTVAVVAALVAWAGLVILAALRLGDDPFRFPVASLVAGGALLLAGLALALSWAGNESPGALDNASGLATLLAVASAARDHPDVAFLVTDGEELGLAGARAVPGDLPPVQGVINVDGVDDHGRYYLAEGHGFRRTGSAPQLAAALLTAGTVLDLPMERRVLPRSMLVDHVPIAEWGIPALTMMRGDWRSLLRVHQRGDDASRIDGAGAAEAATLLRAALRLLRDKEGSHLAGRRATGP